MVEQTHTSDRTAVLAEIAKAAVHPSSLDTSEVARAALMMFYGLCANDGIYGGSEFADRMGYRGRHPDTDLLDEIAADLASEFDGMGQEARQQLEQSVAVTCNPLASTAANMVDLSTAHITEHDGSVMTALARTPQEAHGCPRVLDHGAGWVVFVMGGEEARPDVEAAMKKAGLSTEFIAIHRHADDLGAIIINLDTDGEASEVLPKFDW